MRNTPRLCASSPPARPGFGVVVMPWAGPWLFGRVFEACASVGGGLFDEIAVDCQCLVSGGSGIPFPWVELCLGAGLCWLFGRAIL